MNTTGYSSNIKGAGKIELNARPVGETTGPIPSSLVQLHDALDYLRTQLALLSERLSPVLAPVPVEDSLSKGPGYSGRSPFCNTVAEATFVVSQLQQEVNRLHDRLEL